MCKNNSPCGSSTPCGGCPPLVNDPCRSSNTCEQEMDASCVKYRRHDENGYSRLQTLGLPAGANLQEFMEAVDERLGELDGTEPSSEGQSSGSTPVTVDLVGILKVSFEGTGALRKQVLSLDVGSLLSVIRNTPSLLATFSTLVGGVNLQS